MELTLDKTRTKIRTPINELQHGYVMYGKFAHTHVDFSEFYK